MPQSLIRAGFTAAAGLGALLGLLAADVDASGPGIQRNWINSAGGSFHNATNWLPFGVPGPLDTAEFDVGALYTVSFSQSATNKLLVIDDIDVTFDLPPLAVYALNGVVIGDNNTLTPGGLRLTNGIVSVQPLPPPPPPEPPPPPLMVRIGKDIGVTGELSVSGTAQFSSTDTVIIGDAGTGLMTIFGGGTVSTALTLLADDVGSAGIVAVDGPGASWTLTGDLCVGNFGSAALDIINGGSVTSAFAARIADNSGSDGTATIDGAGSNWTLTTTLFVGNAGTGRLIMNNGGALSSARVRIGDELFSTGIVTIDGPTSTWTDSVEISVGNSGSGSLTVTNAATVSGLRLTVAEQPGSSGTATVDGPGSSVDAAGEVILGDSGGTGTLSVTNGGLLEGPSLTAGKSGTGVLDVSTGGTASFSSPSPNRIGDLAGSDGTLLVDGTGSTATFGGTLFVGNFGSGSIEITNGGSVTTPMVFVADDLGSAGSIVLDGVGSTWTVNSELFLGNASSGTASITNGGAAFTSRVKLGDNPGSSGTVTVDGPGSIWIDSVEIFVGNFGSGSLAITNGAAVSGPRVTIGDDPGSSGILTVSGPGSTLSLSQQLSVGDLGQGTLRVVDGGVAGAPVVLVNTGGLVRGNATISGSVTNFGTVSPGLSTGELVVDGSYTQSITGALAIELGCTAADALTVTGAAQLAGTLDLSFAAAAPTAGRQFAILSAATVAGIFSQVNAPVAVSVTYEPTAVVVTVLEGDPPAAGDLNGDGSVGVPDLLALLAAWGACPPEGGCPADLDGNGIVGVPELLTLLASWGRCV